MTDDRLIDRINAELREGHATNGELREQLIVAQKQIRQQGDVRDALSQLQEARAETEAQRKAAEGKAAAAIRKLREKEHELFAAQDKIEELEAELERVGSERDEFLALDERIAKAKGISDLLS